ncbi:MAG: WYL domain-containing transcriptional regulator [Chitinophagaceae bacterium]|nr:WYL domain-containing transcriptional regulator [Chitinophagaceae bacterium]
MSDQPKIQRLLRLMLLLSGGRKYSRKEIAERLGILERSVYRYLNTLESAGLVVNRGDGYNLLLEQPAGKGLQRLFHFTGEEAYILYRLLEQVDGSASVKSRLIKKLHTLYDFRSLIEIQGSSVLEHVTMLKEAIAAKKTVVLHQYRSSNSQTITDRKVEPFDFLPAYEGVWALDTEDRQPKQFLLSRIRKVEILPAGQRFTSLHRQPFTDAFRISAAQPVATVRLRLTLKARNLLQEEFPLAMEYIKESGERYLLTIPVAGYSGIGRFVMGLPEDVEIIKNKAFKDFLMKRIKAWMSDRS